jgi:hypothetical protein
MTMVLILRPLAVPVMILLLAIPALAQQSTPTTSPSALTVNG